MPNFKELVYPLVLRKEMNARTVAQIIQGRNTSKNITDKICAELNMPVNNVFDIVDKHKPLSSLTIHHHHRLISAMLTTAVQWQLISSNPAERVKSPKVERTEAHYYNIDEVEKMLALLEIEPIKYKVMIHIVLFCGLRLGELSDLNWSDIDFDEQTITISKQLQYLPGQGVYEVQSAKTESGNRSISIPSSLAELLKEYKAWQEDEKYTYSGTWIESEKLFTQDNGAPMFPTSPSHWFRRFVKKNNLPPLTFHQLRHTNASLLISMGVDVATVSKRLGHADKSVTLKTYTHAIKQHDREAVEKLENLLIKKDD